MYLYGGDSDENYENEVIINPILQFPQKSSKKKWIIIGIVIVLAIAVVGFMIYLRKKSVKPTIKPTIKPTTKPTTKSSRSGATNAPLQSLAPGQTRDPNAPTEPQPEEPVQDDIIIQTDAVGESLNTGGSMDGSQTPAPTDIPCSSIVPVTTFAEKCEGLEYRCFNGEWVKVPFKSCPDLYRDMNIRDDTELTNICKNLIGDPMFDTEFKCKENSDGVVVDRIKLCSKTVPKTIEEEKCLGLKYVCNKRTNTWVTGPQDKCTDIYDDLMVKDRDTWDDKCKDKVGDQTWYNKFICTDISGGGTTVEIKKKCPKLLPSNMVLSDADKCAGILKFKCTDDGWAKDKTGTCGDIYRSLPNVGSMDDWAKFCDNKIGDQNFFNKLTCTDVSNNANIVIKPKCPKVVPAAMQLTDLEKCMGWTLECTDDGWKKVKAKTCDNIYKGIGVTQNDWLNFCTDKVGDTNYYNRLSCADVSGGTANITIKQLCPKQEPATTFTKAETCQGIGLVCNEEKQTWVKDYKFNSCDKMFGYASGIESDTAGSWMAKCKDSLGGDDTYNGDARCVVTKDSFNRDAVKGVITPGCKKVPPPGACKDANGVDGKCPPGQVCICDGSNNAWRCVPQQPGSACTIPQAALCIDNNGNKVRPKCFQCNPQTATGVVNRELACPNTAPSARCLTSLWDIRNLSAKHAQTNADVIYSAAARGGLNAIYPLYDNARCNAGGTPFNDITTTGGDNYIGHTQFNNPQGWVDTDHTNPANMRYYPPNFNIRKFKNTAGYDCVWSDQEIAKSLNDPGQSVCRGRGRFIQNGTSKSGRCECNPGFAGSNCQFGRDRCSNRGNPTDTGACVCDTDSAGPTCQFTRAVTCNNRGTPQNDGTCSGCIAGTAGANCQFTRADCSNRGNPNNNGTCSCDTNSTNPIDGPKCQFTRNETCNGVGTPINTGSCILCPAGYSGTNCQHTRDNKCSGRGNPVGNEGIPCGCDSGFAGAQCTRSAADCNFRGIATNTGCQCNGGFAGATCARSRANCNNRGNPTDTGCECDQGFAGATCERSRANCNNKANPTDTGCVQPCDPGFAGPACQFTDSGTCNGNGTARSDGSCNCKPGFLGTNCQFSRGTTCSGNGTVSATGTCTCDGGWTGKKCDKNIAACSAKNYTSRWFNSEKACTRCCCCGACTKYRRDHYYGYNANEECVLVRYEDHSCGGHKCNVG
jgi:hypothetical protein